MLLANQGRTIQGLSDDDKKRVFGAVLDDMINDRLVNRQAANETVDPLDVEKRFGELSAQYPSPGGFEAEIRKSGQTPEQVRENLRRQIAQQQWVEHQIADQITVTPQEVEKFYKDGPPSKFDAPEMIKRQPHPRRRSPRRTAGGSAGRREKGGRPLCDGSRKANPSTTWLAQTPTIPRSKPMRADLGYFSRERIMPEFADAAFKLKVRTRSARRCARSSAFTSSS